MHYAGGYILGGPPIDNARAAQRAWLSSLMQGSSMYSLGAGGFDQVPSLPQIQTFRPPTVRPDHDAELVQLYATTPAAFRQRLDAMFVNTSRARTGR